MSWYFFGGFSAYLIVPSGRWRNHSGMLAHPGMIGRAWNARSSAISSPSRAAASTKRSKSSSVPSPGSTAVCPPSAAPIAHGLPGSSGPGVERVVAALAEAAADRVDRRQVEDVEAHRRDVGQPRRRLAERGAARRDPVPAERGNISYHAPKRARSRSTITRSTRSNRVARLRSGMRGHRRGQRPRERGRDARRPSRRPPRRQLAEQRSLRRRRARPFGRVGDERRAFEQLARHVLPGAELLRQLLPPGREPIDPGLDRVLVPPERVDGERAPASGRCSTRCHRRLSRHVLRRRARAVAQRPPRARRGRRRRCRP